MSDPVLGDNFRRVIWTCWFQGLDDAPSLVQRCIQSWIKHNPGWDLRCLDRHTVLHYAPSLNDLNLTNAVITAASLSDIVRINLLHEYGGVWVDASLFCNRPLDAPDLISPVSETTATPGNEGLSAADRQARIDRCWKPFHETIDRLIETRAARGLETRLVSVHSFTPVYKGVDRPWHIGIIHDDDARLSAPLIAALQQQGGFTVGANQPYSPADRVYFTLERHARSRGLLCAMIEIRNDEIRDKAGQKKWGERLAGIFTGLEPARLPKPPPFRPLHSIEGTI